MGNVVGGVVGGVLLGPVGFIAGGAIGMSAEINHHENGNSTSTERYQRAGLKSFSLVQNDHGDRFEVATKCKKSIYSSGLSNDEAEDIYERIELLRWSDAGDVKKVHEVFKKGEGAVINIKAIKNGYSMKWVVQKIEFSVHDVCIRTTRKNAGFSVVLPIGSGTESSVRYVSGELKQATVKELEKRVNDEMNKHFLKWKAVE